MFHAMTLKLMCAVQGHFLPTFFPKWGRASVLLELFLWGSDFIRSPNRIRVFFYDQNKVNSLITLSNFTWVEPLFKDSSGRLQKELWLSRVETAKW